MRIKIPFAVDMAKAVIKGRKTCTSRTKRYGKVGDTFVVGNKEFEMTDVRHVSLWGVAFTFHWDEGFNSVEGFINKWEELHPRKGYNPNQLVWLHFFAERISQG